MKKILVTGFEPFGGESVNPSWQAVERLPDEINGVNISKIEIPCAFNESVSQIRKALEQTHYDAVLAIGQAGGREAITPERVGINIDDAPIADNIGNKPIDEAIYEDGENAYFSNLPIKRMVQEMTNLGIAARVSNTAGTYVCNHVLYSLGYLEKHHFHGLKFGFIHVPYSDEQVTDSDAPSMDIETIKKALVIAIQVMSNYKQDALLSMGDTH